MNEHQQHTHLTAAIAELSKSVKELTKELRITKRKVGQKKSIDINNKLDKELSKLTNNELDNINNINNNSIYNIYKSKNRANIEMHDDINQIVEHYRTYHPKALRTLSKKSKTYLGVKGRLGDGYAVSELVDAVNGMHKSPFHLGRNENKTKYLSLELCMRNAEQVDRFISIAREVPSPDVGNSAQKTVDAARKWLDDE